ncbi:hypothetical protein BGX24_005231, partial [Mortierella sp. AD032]
MSFTDLERGLSTPPLSPDHQQQQQRDLTKYPVNIPISPSSSSSATRGNAHSPPFTASSSPPPVRLPSGLQVTRGNSRDSIGLGLGLQNPLQQPTETSPLLQQQRGRRPLASNNNVSRPPMSPPPNSKDNNRRSTKSPIAQHSRFVDENTRIDTPRPTLTPTTAGAVGVVVAAAASSGGERIGFPATSSSSSSTATIPRSPQSVSTSFQSGYQASNYSNRVLGNNNNHQRQVLSPPTSPPQFSPQSSPLHQYRGFIRVDNRGPHDSGVTTAVTSSMSAGAGAAAATHSGVDGDVSSFSARAPNSSNGIDAYQHDGISLTIDASNNNNYNNYNSIHATTTATTTNSSTNTISAFPTSSSALQDQELDYDLMVRHLSQQIFNISSNIAVLERLVPCLGQRHKDTAEMRASLHAVLDGTQELVKSAHGLVKVLARYHQPPSIPHSGVGIGIRSQQQTQQQVELSSWQKKVLVSRRQTHQRLTKDLALVSKDFQVLQREAIEAERCQVAILRRLSSSASMRRLSLRRSDLMDLSAEDIQAGALFSDNGQGSSRSGSGSYSQGHGGINNTSFPGLQPLQHDRELSIQEEALLKELLAMDGELVMQETILQERESEIRKIEEGMVQVLDVMKELGTL